jgi:hypothetical protein
MRSCLIWQGFSHSTDVVAENLTQNGVPSGHHYDSGTITPLPALGEGKGVRATSILFERGGHYLVAAWTGNIRFIDLFGNHHSIVI